MSKELVEYVVKSLVDDPESVVVTEVEGQSSVVLEVSVNTNDMGRLIGKKGRVINAIRTLTQVQGARLGKRISVEVV
ncbi:MAG: KH domain-containing protein [Ardenticatenaceae bacterium]|nr:KH domain-containing protein [Ardenticatenaceae bacterium]